MNKKESLSRRGFLASSIAVATTLQLQQAARALGLSQQADICKLVTEQEVGPYYVADELLRSDIVEGKPGIPLALRITVYDARTCKPLEKAAIDIWHCDALGLYSGFTKQNPMGPGGRGGPGGPPPGFDPQHPGNHPGPPENMGPPPENHPTDQLTFLRGIQLTGPDGVVSFKTIFPGYYMGRTNHIHFKVRVDGSEEGKTYHAGHTSHTGQVFFPEAVSAKLMQREPYNQHKIHRTKQEEDQVFLDQHGEFSIANLVGIKPDAPEAGLKADLIAFVDPTATPAPAPRRGGPPPPQ
jgi:protocatechuate 3,4-dioxygenase beta subunit